MIGITHEQIQWQIHSAAKTVLGDIGKIVGELVDYVVIVVGSGNSCLNITAMTIRKISFVRSLRENILKSTLVSKKNSYLTGATCPSCFRVLISRKAQLHVVFVLEVCDFFPSMSMGITMLSSMI